MNPIVFALRHPYTVMVGIVALIFGGAIASSRTKVDIFPALNQPVVYVCQPYGGLDPNQVEGLLTNYYEFHFLYVSGIQRVESKNIQGMALMKLYFHPGTDMAQSMAETVAAVNRARFMMPPGTVPPFVSRFDTGSAAIGYLVLSSETKSIKDIQDMATLKVRPSFSNIPGISTPPAFGGNQRAIIVNLNMDELRSLNLTPEDIVDVIQKGNVVSPSGNVRMGDRLVMIPSNAMAGTNPIKDLGNIAVTKGPNPRYLRDVVDQEKGIEDGSDITSGYVLVNGRRSVYMLVTKRADASTLDVVNELKKAMPKLREQVPEDVKIEFAFDQSPIVKEAMWGVAIEGLLGAVLTGLMVVLFLRDWRAVIVVVLNIPLALVAAMIGIWLCGHTINLMTLGGLALAVGILVDEATVEVENIHTQMEHTTSIARAVRLGNAETAVPRLLALLCILAVFIPSAFMEGSARALFLPLSISVAFAMIASYILSSTFVPVLSVWLLKPLGTHHDSQTRLQKAYAAIASRVLSLRYILVPGYLAGSVVVILLIGSQVGREIFPSVDRGQFQLRLRAPTGTRIERTEELAQEAVRFIKQEVGTENVELTVGYIGMFPTNYPVQAIYQWTSGPEECYIKVAFRTGTGIRINELKASLRDKLTEHLRQFLIEKWRTEGLTDTEIVKRAPGLRTSFEPADIINEVMSFGSPTPVEVVVFGPKLPETIVHAEKIKKELAKIKALRDLQTVQAQDYPTVEVRVDREKAGTYGVTMADVSRSLVAATASSRYLMPNYWRDPATGQGYIVQVQVPVSKISTSREIELMPVKGNHSAYGAGEAGGMTGGIGRTILLRDVASVREGTIPGEVDRYNMRRMISLTANVEGEDLGSVDRQVRAAVVAAGDPPRGATVAIRGQLEPMSQIFSGMSLGLGIAVLVIFLLLTGYFQSIKLALAAIAAVPGALSGVALTLWLTGTTLNLQSFMGTIMTCGVAVANAILLITFAERERLANLGDAREAALSAGTSRFRPVIMTSCAMIAGMIPMALGFGEGGDQTAPLGRAVVGGLIVATAATLLILPSVFTILQRKASTNSASLDPDDPESAHHAPA